MAKAIVKCLYCGQSFDRNSEEFVKPTANRYAHKECYNNRDADVQEKEELNKKIKEYLGTYYNAYKVRTQLDKYYRDGMSACNILKALEYFYDVKGNSAVNSGGGIGIIPHIYDESVKYWANKKQISKKFAEINIEKPKERIVEVKRQSIKKPVNVDFFDLK